MKQSLFGVSHLACHPCPAGKRAHTHAPPHLHSRVLGRRIGRGPPAQQHPHTHTPFGGVGGRGLLRKGGVGGSPFPPSLAAATSPAALLGVPAWARGHHGVPKPPPPAAGRLGVSMPPNPAPAYLHPPAGAAGAAARCRAWVGRAAACGGPVPTRRPVPPRGLAAPAGPISPTPSSVCCPPFAGRCAWLCYYGI